MLRILWTACGFYAGLAFISMAVDDDSNLIAGKGLAVISGIMGGVALLESDLRKAQDRRAGK